MIHSKAIVRSVRPLSLPRKAAWCQPAMDGFCFDVDCQCGKIGIRVTGGFAGVDYFYPIMPSLKCLLGGWGGE